MDDYEMTFYSVRADNVKVIAEFERLFYDQLQQVFTQVTGLNTYL
jgi:hypothetical protein